MKRLYTLNVMLLCAVIAGFVACVGKEQQHKQSFTEADSLTEIYLTLQDSMLNSWNEITNDENKKIRSLHQLLHTLMAAHPDNQGVLSLLGQRLDQLDQLRFTRESMEDPHSVEEYDFASNSLINEIITFTEADPDYARNKELRQIVDEIKITDQRIPIFRADYDSAAMQYNNFLEKNKLKLDKLDQDLTLEKKPLFE